MEEVRRESAIRRKACKNYKKMEPYPIEIKLFVVNWCTEYPRQTYGSIGKLFGIPDGTIKSWCQDRNLSDILDQETDLEGLFMIEETSSKERAKVAMVTTLQDYVQKLLSCESSKFSWNQSRSEDGSETLELKISYRPKGK